MDRLEADGPPDPGPPPRSTGEFDVLNGDADRDTVSCGALRCTLNGGDGPDTLDGGPAGDTLSGGPGADTMRGNGGDDGLDGGEGADDMSGGPGVDTATYVSRTVAIVVTVGTPSGQQPGATDAGTDNDGAANERDNVRDSIEKVVGGTKNDKFTATDVLATGATVPVGRTFEGRDGDDTLIGGDFMDTLRGGVQKDTLVGGRGSDSLFGEEGDDSLIGGRDELLAGGDGARDTLDGGPPTNTCRQSPEDVLINCQIQTNPGLLIIDRIVTGVRPPLLPPLRVVTNPILAAVQRAVARIFGSAGPPPPGVPPSPPLSPIPIPLPVAQFDQLGGQLNVVPVLPVAGSISQIPQFIHSVFLAFPH
jgi:hypothetical protein